MRKKRKAREVLRRRLLRRVGEMGSIHGGDGERSPILSLLFWMNAVKLYYRLESVTKTSVRHTRSSTS